MGLVHMLIHQPHLAELLLTHRTFTMRRLYHRFTSHNVIIIIALQLTWSSDTTDSPLLLWLLIPQDMSQRHLMMLSDNTPHHSLHTLFKLLAQLVTKLQQ